MGEGMRSQRVQKIKAAQTALIEAIAKAPDDTNIGILTFNGWLYRPGPMDKPKLEAAIKATYPGGGTPLWSYMQAAATELLKLRQANGNVGFYKILVVTDGQAQDQYLAEDSSDKIGYLSDILRRGITIDCIGVMMNSDHYLATRINGTYMKADDPESLKKAVAKSVAEIGVTGKDVEEECFATAQLLPDKFVKDVIRGLTRYENQAIGEVAPATDTVDMSSSQIPDVGTSSANKWIIGGVIGFIVVIVIIFIMTKACAGDW
jgi:hypothetical protein